MTTESKDKLKKFLDTKFWAILGLVVMQGWSVVSDRIGAGKDAQDKLKFEAHIEEMMSDANVWDRVFSSSYLTNEVSRITTEAKTQIKDDIYATDVKKVDLIGVLGGLTGLRNDSIIPKLAKLMIAVENGEIMLKSDAEAFIEDEVKKRTTRTVRGNF